MADKGKLGEEAEALYIAVAEASRDESGANSKLFHQEQLLELSTLSDMRDLMPLVQHLTNQMLLRTLKVKGKLAWGPRPRETARQMATLDQQDRMIYSIIEDAHTTGVWSRDIKRRTSIPQNNVMKSLNKMEKNNFIKSVKNVKNPGQKTYMVFNLVPSEDVTGNSFFDAGDLDENFRDTVMNLIIFHVRANSWAEGRRPIKRNASPPVATPDDDGEDVAGAPTEAKKRKRGDDVDEISEMPRTKHRSNRRDSATEPIQIPYRAGSHDYPTAESIHQYLAEANVFKAKSLTVPEVQACIDVLIWDDKLERFPTKSGVGWGYRTVLGVTSKGPDARMDDYDEGPGMALTEVPCGRCPVFDLCHEGGPVNPAECVYLDEWLLQ